MIAALKGKHGGTAAAGGRDHSFAQVAQELRLPPEGLLVLPGAEVVEDLARPVDPD